MKVIHVLRKPLGEGTVAKNVLKHGTGALNIDASRISTTEELKAGSGGLLSNVRDKKAWGYHAGPEDHGFTQNPGGRWPANVILQHLVGCDESCTPGCPVTALDEQSGVTSSNAMGGAGQYTGGASRFFKQVRP